MMAPGGVAYEVLGDGAATLVAVHGGPGMDRASLRPWLDPLAEQVRLVYLDLPGHGRSEPPTDYSLAAMADAVDALVEHLGEQRVVLLGHSYGGFVSLTCAVRHPQRIAGLVLVDTAASASFRGESLQVAQRRATPAMLEALDRLWSGVLTTDAEFKRDWGVIAPLYFHRLPDEDIERAGQTCTYRLATRKAALPSLASYDVRDRLPDIRVPSLVIVGRHDWITAVSQAEALAAGLPESRLVIFDNSGHLPFAEEPAEFLTLVRTWLTDVQGAAA
jgi:proline iminopeptidase